MVDAVFCAEVEFGGGVGGIIFGVVL